MAEETRKINIVELDIEQDQALSDLTDLQREIQETKDETNALTKANKELSNTGKENTAQYAKNSKQVEANKIQLKSLNKEYNTQQKVVNDVLQVEQRELGTLEKLTLRNKDLRQELRELNLETEEGTERQKEIVKEIDANTDTIKENSDSLVQSKMNVGNYTEGIEDSIPALKGMLGGLKQVTRASKAFLATPIGLILAAAAAGIGLLIKGFQRSQMLADKMKVANAGLRASFDVIIDRVSNGMEKAFKKLREDPVQAIKDVGKAIITNLVNRVKALPQIFIKAFEAVKNAIKGNMDEARESVKELGKAFVQLQTGMDTAQQQKFIENTKKMREEIAAEVKIAKALAEAEIRLNDLEIELLGTTAELTKEREKAKLATRDDTLSIEERLAAQDRAIALDKQLLNVEMNAAKERARISQERIDLGKSSRDELRENAELQAEVTRLESAYFTRSKELASERLSLNNMLKAEEAARAEATKQALLEEAQALELFVNNEIEIWKLRNQSAIQKGEELTDSLIAEEKDRLDELEEQRIAATDLSFENELISRQEHELRLLQIHKDATDAKLAITQQYEKERTKIEEAAAKLRVELAKEEKDLKLEAAKYFFSAIANIASENTLAYKGSTTALMAIDTYKGALAAYASFQSLPPPLGPILGGIAAGAVTVMGLDSIRKVWAIDPKGTRSVSGPSTTNGGNQTVAPAIPAAQVSSSGGLVERDLDIPSGKIEIEQVPVVIVDQVTADQQNLKEIETLASV